MRKLAVVFVLTMLFITLVPLFIPQARATSTEITLLDPASGFVGTLCKVEGTINTTNGFYIVRWNQTLNITTGYANEYNVSTSFSIPPTIGAPLGRDILVELIDNSTQTVGTAYFKLYTKYYIKADKPSPPDQLLEGNTTRIWVNVTGGEANTVYTANVSVTDPSGKNYTSAPLVWLSNTTTKGYGEGNTVYPDSFGTDAHTNYTGTYRVFFNETLASDSFTIGLTDKVEYYIDETVLIQGTGYRPNETVTANVKVEGLSAATFPKNVTASTDGVITFSWKILSDATPGIYTLTLANATSPGTVKTPPDQQEFEVLGFTCQVQTVNHAKEPVAGVMVKVYNASTNIYLNVNATTDISGWVRFSLNGGNYTFKAFWNDVEVGIRSQNISKNEVLTIELELTHMRIVVEDEAHEKLSFIDLKLETTYEVKSYRTNATGTWEIYNFFANVSYVFEAWRYNLPLPGTPLQNKTLSLPWNNIIIVVPTYTMFVQVRDSKNAPATGLGVEAYEWSSGIGEPAQPRATTNDDGNVTLSLTFGRYRLRLYKGTTFLNEVTVDLVEDQSSWIVRSDVYNVDLSVRVVDYFGQPIPNVFVEFQRKVDSDYRATENQATGADGVARFNSIIGGDSRVYVSVAGTPGETQYLYLAGSRETEVVFKMGGYVAIAGYALETSKFVTIILLLILIVAFIITSTRKRLSHLLQRRKK